MFFKKHQHYFSKEIIVAVKVENIKKGQEEKYFPELIFKKGSLNQNFFQKYSIFFFFERQILALFLK